MTDTENERIKQYATALRQKGYSNCELTKSEIISLALDCLEREIESPANESYLSLKSCLEQKELLRQQNENLARQNAELLHELQEVWVGLCRFLGQPITGKIDLVGKVSEVEEFVETLKAQYEDAKRLVSKYENQLSFSS